MSYKGTRFSDGEIVRIRKLANATKSDGTPLWNSARIAARMGVSERDVKEILGGRSGRITPGQAKEMMSLLKQGQKPEDVAFHLDVPADKVQKHLDRMSAW
jgi:hypothetical protein